MKKYIIIISSHKKEFEVFQSHLNVSFEWTFFFKIPNYCDNNMVQYYIFCLRMFFGRKDTVRYLIDTFHYSSLFWCLSVAIGTKNIIHHHCTPLWIMWGIFVWCIYRLHAFVYILNVNSTDTFTRTVSHLGDISDSLVHFHVFFSHKINFVTVHDDHLMSMFHFGWYF